MKKEIDALMAKAFNVPRDPRSEEYKAGVRAVLEYRINGIEMRCPFLVGTSQADAYFAGTDEGHRIWRGLQAAPGEESAQLDRIVTELKQLIGTTRLIARAS